MVRIYVPNEGLRKEVWHTLLFHVNICRIVFTNNVRFSHVAPSPRVSTDALSSIEMQEPGPLPEVVFSGSKSILLVEPSGENQTLIDVPSSENRACVVIKHMPNLSISRLHTIFVVLIYIDIILFYSGHDIARKREM